MYTSNSNRGFIALISVLIISVVLLTAVLSIAHKGISSRFLLLDLERKAESEKWAEGCVMVGIIALVNDPLYSVSNRTVPVGEDGGECTLTIVPGSGDRTIHARATLGGATTNLEVEINPLAATVEEAILPNGWRELPTF